MPELSVIIPAYNEEKEITLILNRLGELPLDMEIIIVDDYSDDRTIEMIKNIENEQIKLICHDMNMGKAEAVKTGLTSATGVYTVIQDADNEYNPKNLVPMLNLIKEFNSIAVYGNRFSSGFPNGMSIAQKTGNLLMTSIFNIIMRTSIRDMETCYKMFRRDACPAKHIQSKGFGIDPEITINLIRNGIRIVELPIDYVPRTYQSGKKIRLRDAFVTLATIIRKGIV